MKKIIISTTTISVFLFTGCFTDSDTATVKINLGNIPIAKVEKKSIIDKFLMFFTKEAVAQNIPNYVMVVHLGAFDVNNQLLAKKSITRANYPENNTVEFDVPAGINRKIVVLGENSRGDVGGPNFIGYHGAKDKIALVAGEVETVLIEVKGLNEDYIQLTNGDIGALPEMPAKWKYVAGASAYEIYDFDTDIDAFKYYTSITSNDYLHYINGSYQSGSFRLCIDFDFAEMKSDFFDFEILD